MTSQIVMVGNPKESAATIRWCQENGLRAGHLRNPVFVDLTNRIIYANHVVTDDQHKDDEMPPLILGDKYGIGSVPIDAPFSSLLSCAREWPLVVDPPEEICI